jgi:vacuole morphology and inheritance protein 14
MIQRVNMHKKEFNQEKINQIINCLCNSIKPEKVFMEFATIFHDMTDLIFVQDMIETLTFAISSSPFYKALRGKLFGTVPTDFAKDREDLFTHLFNSWCINPISTLTLCLLSQKYELAYNLLNHLSDELDSKKLIQLGTLVQLIESPSFVQLRLQLMKQTEENKYLIKTLQGILMILPQSKTFTVLKTRLDCVNITNFSLPFVNDGQLVDENGEPQETPEALALRQKQKEQDAAQKRKAIIECLK